MTTCSPGGPAWAVTAIFILIVGLVVLCRGVCSKKSRPSGTTGLLASAISTNPLAAFVMVALLGAVLSASAFYDSCGNWKAVNIEDDFFNYIKSDHATTHRFDELRAALNDKSSESCMWSPSDAAVAATRRLVGGSAPPTDPVAPAPTNTTVAPQETLSTAAVSSDYRLAELQIMYIKPEFGDVLDAHSVSRMREIETQLMADPLYSKLCLPKSLEGIAHDTVRDCASPELASAFFFDDWAAGVVAPDRTKALKFLATKELQPKFTDAWYGLDHLESNVTSAYFYLWHNDDTLEEWLTGAGLEVLRGASDDRLRVLYANPWIQAHEIAEAVVVDLHWTYASFALVFCIVWVYLGSAFLAAAGLGGIAMSFGLTYWFYSVVLAVPRMSLLNFVALFIVLGVGADDIFIFTDTYRIIKLGNPRAPVSERLHAAFMHAGRAMVTTTATSALAFFANIISALPALRAFGVFLGVNLVMNFLIVVTLFPAAVVLHELYIAKAAPVGILDGDGDGDVESGGAGRISAAAQTRTEFDNAVFENNAYRGRSASGARRLTEAGAVSTMTLSSVAAGSRQSEAAEDRQMKFRLTADGGWTPVDLFLHNEYAEFVHTHRRRIVAAGITIVAAAVVLASATLEQTTEYPMFFKTDHNIGMVGHVEQHYLHHNVEETDAILTFPYQCPSGDTELACAGHGMCASWGECLCESGWAGNACDERAADDADATTTDGSGDGGRHRALAAHVDLDAAAVESKLLAYIRSTLGDDIARQVLKVPAREGAGGPEGVGADRRLDDGNGNGNGDTDTDTDTDVDGDAVVVEAGAMCNEAYCSGNGICSVTMAGPFKCGCYVGYDGDRCEADADEAKRLEHNKVATVDLYWGVAELHRTSVSSYLSYDIIGRDSTQTESEKRVAYDTDFDLSHPEAQLASLDACGATNAQPHLQIREKDTLCVMEHFAAWLSDDKNGTLGVLPLPSEDFFPTIELWLQTTGRSFERYVGLDCGSKRVRWLRYAYTTSIAKTTPAREALEYYDAWQNWVGVLNDRMPPSMGTAEQATWLWVKSTTELKVIESMLASGALSFAIAFVGIGLFTQSWHLAAIATGTIVGIVSCLLAWMTGIMGWKFGAVEGVSVIVFIGFSVDYTLHIAQAYNRTWARSKFLRLRASLLESGGAVLMAACTTIGSSIFLLFCTIQINAQIGLIVLVNTFFSLMFGLVFFAAVLAECGPARVNADRASRRVTRRHALGLLSALNAGADVEMTSSVRSSSGAPLGAAAGFDDDDDDTVGVSVCSIPSPVPSPREVPRRLLGLGGGGDVPPPRRLSGGGMMGGGGGGGGGDVPPRRSSEPVPPRANGQVAVAVAAPGQGKFFYR